MKKNKKFATRVTKPFSRTTTKKGGDERRIIAAFLFGSENKRKIFKLVFAPILHPFVTHIIILKMNYSFRLKCSQLHKLFGIPSIHRREL